jgi:arginyl-tRNA synthetase
MVTTQHIFNNIFKTLGLPEDLALIGLSQRPELSDYQINGAFNGAKILKQSPSMIAQKIIDQLTDEVLTNFEVSQNNGFINLKIKDKTLIESLKNNLKVEQKKEKVIIDFSGPNIAKSMHVGHVRSTLIGQALVNIYKYQGNSVIADNHIGDFGTPLGIVISEILSSPNFNWSLCEIEQAYIQGSLKYKNPLEIDFQNLVKENTRKLQNQEEPVFSIWKNILSVTLKSLDEDYSKLKIKFDWVKGESSFQSKIVKMINELENKKLCFQSNGAKVVDLGLESPLILEKSGGGYLYHTTDLACLQERLEEFSKIIYVVDNRQSLHFKLLFAAAKKFGWLKSQEVLHIDFGTINGSDNKPFKTRSGGVLKLSDLINSAISKAQEKTEDLEDAQKLGLGALKFGELKHNRKSDYVFDLDKFLDTEGYTGPYVMYAIVRGQSILNKAETDAQISSSFYSPEEKSLALTLSQFALFFNLALKNHEPHVLCEYGYNLASKFNSFYHAHNILKENNEKIKKHRLALTLKTVETLTKVLDLLGIEIPSKM